MVLIDTSVWIPALQRGNSLERAEVARLLEIGEAGISGLILAEVLRGARDAALFEELKDELLAAHLLEENLDVWLTAARILLDLKLSGQSIPFQDAVIAAEAIESGAVLFSHDEHFERVPGLQMHKVPDAN